MGHPALPEETGPRSPVDSSDWLAVDDLGCDEVVWVRITGGTSGHRADDLWSTLEMALQDAAGRMVVVDLARVTGFDVGTVNTLVSVARAVKRWHVDMCAVVNPSSAMNDYLRAHSLDHLIPLYPSDEAAREAIEDDDTSTMLIASYQWALNRTHSQSRPTPGIADIAWTPAA